MSILPDVHRLATTGKSNGKSHFCADYNWWLRTLYCSQYPFNGHLNLQNSLAFFRFSTLRSCLPMQRSLTAKFVSYLLVRKYVQCARFNKQAFEGNAGLGHIYFRGCECRVVDFSTLLRMLRAISSVVECPPFNWMVRFRSTTTEWLAEALLG